MLKMLLRIWTLSLVLFPLIGAESVLYEKWLQEPYHFSSYPQQFMWGAALSEYQNSGVTHCGDSNWAEWERRGKIRNRQDSTCCPDFWNHYPKDIAVGKELGLNAIRFSIEWSRVEPEEGKFDEEVIAHYVKIIKDFKKQGMQPFCTLHHFTNPTWFQKKGGFEKEENIKHYVHYARKVIDKLASRVDFFVTFNEIEIYAFMGYILGDFPPGKKLNIARGVEVMKHMLQAHCQVYEYAKLEGITAQVGLVHNILCFQPYWKNDLFMRSVCSFLTTFVHDTVWRFIETGEFRFDSIMYHAKPWKYEGPRLDFLGVNYYSDPRISSIQTFPPFDGTCFSNEIMTDMPYPIHPEGFYNALKKTKQLNLPIYVTENGIADAKDDRRALWLKSYIKAMSKAIAEGVPVKGYFYWTLVDNFEWAEGWDMKFGLSSFCPQTKERTLKKGSYIYKDIIHQYNALYGNQISRKSKKAP